VEKTAGSKPAVGIDVAALRGTSPGRPSEKKRLNPTGLIHPSAFIPSSFSCKSETIADFYATEIPFLQIILGIRDFKDAIGRAEVERGKPE
jgi:hypothetical protein